MWKLIIIARLISPTGGDISTTTVDYTTAARCVAAKKVVEGMGQKYTIHGDQAAYVRVQALCVNMASPLDMLGGK